jgi:hypothetical protein
MASPQTLKKHDYRQLSSGKDAAAHFPARLTEKINKSNIRGVRCIAIAACLTL